MRTIFYCDYGIFIIFAVIIFVTIVFGTIHTTKGVLSIGNSYTSLFIIYPAILITIINNKVMIRTLKVMMIMMMILTDIFTSTLLGTSVCLSR